MHTLLARQLKRCLGEGFVIPEPWEGFFAAVDEAYQENDMEREMLERSLELSSQELLEANSQMRAVFESIPDLLFRLDHNGVIVDVKAGLTSDLMLQPKELLGKNIQEVSLKQIGARFMETLRKVIAEKTVITVESSHMVDDEEFFYEARVAPLLENQAVAIIRNITERKNAEKERKRIEIQMRNLQKMESIGQLAAGIAHEINTPIQYVSDNTRFLKDSFAGILRVIKTCEEILSATQNGPAPKELTARMQEEMAQADMTYVSEQIPQALDESLQGLEHMANIVRSMKEFSHPGGKEKAAANLNKAVESAVVVSRSEWKYVADVKLDLDSELPLVMCYLGEFNQVMLNLIVNAAHAIGDVVKAQPGSKGVITIQTRLDGECVEIRVGDTGTGIPEAIRSRIFDPFFTTKDIGKGTGQGLALVYTTIVKQHEGAVSFETEVGHGTTFILRLPISGPATVQASGI